MTLATIKLDLVDSNAHAVRDVADIKALTASIKARGVLQPILVVVDGKRFITVAGHHRVAAAKEAGLTEIPALIFEEYADADQVAAQLAENDNRRNLTTMERAKGYQSLLDLGMTEAAVVKATGAKKAEVAAALAIKKASKAVVKEIERVQPSLEEAAALIEFAGDKDALERLATASSQGDFTHRLAYERQEKERRAKVDASKKELKKAGVPEIHEYWRSGTESLSRLKLTPEDHASCPGHAAHVEHQGHVTYFCTKAKLHGASGGGGGLSDEEKARRKAKREGKALWTAATSVRTEHLKLLCSAQYRGTTAPMLPFVADLAWSRGLACGKAHTYGGVTAWEDRVAARARDLRADKATPTQSLFAQAAATMESRIASWVDSSGGTALSPSQIPDDAAAYYALLIETGYVTAECEATLIKAARSKPAAPPRVPPSSPTYQMSTLAMAPKGTMILHAFPGGEPITVAIFRCDKGEDPSTTSTMWQIRFTEAGYPDQATWDELCASKGWDRGRMPGENADADDDDLELVD